MNFKRLEGWHSNNMLIVEDEWIPIRLIADVLKFWEFVEFDASNEVRKHARKPSAPLFLQNDVKCRFFRNISLRQKKIMKLKKD